MSVRHDIHRPAAPLFDPQAYRLVGAYAAHLGAEHNESALHVIETLKDKGYVLGAGSQSQCGHCGAHLKYSALLVRDDYREYIHVGETCLDNRFPLSQYEFQRLRKASELEASKRKARTWIDERHPELAGLDTCDDPFARSLWRGLVRWGSLSERQVAAAAKLLAPKPVDAPIEYCSEKQASFIASLLADRDVPDALRLAVGDPKQVARKHASGFIDVLKSLPWNVKADPVTEPGVYRKNGEIYRVQASRESGRLYAKRLVGTTFEYAAGALRSLTKADRLTLEQAKAIGIETGVCCVCAAVLTDPKSVAAGIGPVCASRV